MRTPFRAYLQSMLVRIGLVVAVLGALPLVLTMLAAAAGLTADPEPNPVVFGVLAFATFWPGMALAAFGALLHHRRYVRGATTDDA